LFGGEEIPTDNALFDLGRYEGVITSDLFGDERYFADPKLFWEHQSRAIAELKTELEDDGWKEIILLDVGANWHRWEHADVTKEDGGEAHFLFGVAVAQEDHYRQLMAEVDRLASEAHSEIQHACEDQSADFRMLERYLAEQNEGHSRQLEHDMDWALE